MSSADVSLNLNSRESQFRAVARVFFSPGTGRPVEMRGLPLQNHLDNVAHLASLWDFNRAFGFKQCPPGTKETRFWLVEAARRHDEGKIRRFHIHPPQRIHARTSFLFRPNH